VQVNWYKLLYCLGVINTMDSDPMSKYGLLGSANTRAKKRKWDPSCMQMLEWWELIKDKKEIFNICAQSVWLIFMCMIMWPMGIYNSAFINYGWSSDLLFMSTYMVDTQNKYVGIVILVYFMGFFSAMNNNIGYSYQITSVQNNNITQHGLKYTRGQARAINMLYEVFSDLQFIVVIWVLISQLDLALVRVAGDITGTWVTTEIFLAIADMNSADEGRQVWPLKDGQTTGLDKNAQTIMNTLFPDCEVWLYKTTTGAGSRQEEATETTLTRETIVIRQKLDTAKQRGYTED